MKKSIIAILFILLLQSCINASVTLSAGYNLFSHYSKNMRSVAIIPDINLDISRLNIGVAFGESILSNNTIFTAKYRIHKNQPQGLSFFSNLGGCVQVAKATSYIFIINNSADYYYQKNWIISFGLGFDLLNYTDQNDSFTLLSPRLLLDLNNPFGGVDISLQFIKYGVSF
tara:strand:+ start:509 stop:1021 length:513 start_codon:yes stop_codon:yes gene_type:complete